VEIREVKLAQRNKAERREKVTLSYCSNQRKSNAFIKSKTKRGNMTGLHTDKFSGGRNWKLQFVDWNFGFAGEERGSIPKGRQAILTHLIPAKNIYGSTTK
jgi:hypothetical protein